MLSLVSLGGCAELFDPKPRPLKLALANLPKDGVALVVDGCVQRRAPMFVRDYFAVSESHALAQLVEKGARDNLERHGVAVKSFGEPFVCGFRGSATKRDARVAEKFDVEPRKTLLPVARNAAVGPDSVRGTALRLLFAQAAAYDPELFDDTPSPLPEATRGVLKGIFKTRYVLLAGGAGRYSSTAVAFQNFLMDTAMGMVGAGGQGVYDDTVVNAGLVDLETGRGVWGNRPRSDSAADGNGIDPISEFAPRAQKDVDKLLKPFWSGDDHPYPSEAQRFIR